MTARRGGWRIWGAILAAYLLVLQAALAGMTLGAHAAGPQSGPFDGIICSTGAVHEDVAPGKDKTAGLPNCCVVGCLMSGGVAPAPDAAEIVPPRPLIAPAGRSVAFDAVAATPDRSPRTTRAPPRAA